MDAPPLATATVTTSVKIASAIGATEVIADSSPESETASEKVIADSSPESETASEEVVAVDNFSQLMVKRSCLITRNQEES